MDINCKNLSKIIFITGGTSSGKSEFAEYLGRKSNNIAYIALSEPRPQDINWQKKIYHHRKRRPKEWELIETNNLISTLIDKSGPILIDSIGGFIMESINKNDDEWDEKIDLLLALLKKKGKHHINCRRTSRVEFSF